MKKIRGILLPICIVICLLLAMPVFAETQQPEYGPMLPSTLTAEEKYELMNSLYEADISYVAEAIQRGDISCQELTWYYLQRIEKYEEPYNCFITLCDNAMEIARQRDAALVAGTAEGNLYGVPIVVKDNIKYEGYPTTDGDSWRKNDTYSAAIVENLLAQGVIVLGKTNMSTYAGYASHSTSKVAGETKGAYGLNLSPGGSSGGSAVAVSLNFAIAGLGTDTNASLRYPAVINGCISMRHTRGVISRSGITILNSYRDVPGVITRSVMDQALMLDAMIGTTNYAENLNADALNGARIGVLKELSGPVSSQPIRSASKIDQEVMEAFAQAQEEMRACGAEVIEVSISNFFDLSDRYSALCKVMDTNHLDAIIYPTYVTTPLRIGVDENGVNWSKKSQNFSFNCHLVSPPTGAPEIAFPIGYHSLGSGIGLSMMAKKGQDQLLLDLAYSYTLQYDKRVAPTGAPNDVVKPTLQVYYEDLDAEKGVVTTEDGEAYVTVYEAWSEERQNLPVLTKENYTFLGWSASKDGSTGLIKPKDATAQHISATFADDSQTVMLYPQWQKIVVAISVAQLPVETEYTEGEDLLATGLQLLVEYADGSKDYVANGFFLNGENLTEEEITVFYQGKTTTFLVSLSPKPFNYIYVVVGVLIVASIGGILIVATTKKKKKNTQTVNV